MKIYSQCQLNVMPIVSSSQLLRAIQRGRRRLQSRGARRRGGRLYRAPRPCRHAPYTTLSEVTLLLR